MSTTSRRATAAAPARGSPRPAPTSRSPAARSGRCGSARRSGRSRSARRSRRPRCRTSATLPHRGEPPADRRDHRRATPGSAILLGPIAAIDTVGGYTVYKCFVFLTTIGAIWALLAATRLLRGEEDAGRWQLVLAGRARPPARATAATLVALGAAVGVIFAGTTVHHAARRRATPTSASASASTVLYGAQHRDRRPRCSSRSARSRRSSAGPAALATGLGMGVFGVAFVLRMIADSGPSTKWLLWSTPFGWTELMRPVHRRTTPGRSLPAVAAVVVLGLAATRLAARRERGDRHPRSADVAPLRAFRAGVAARARDPARAAGARGVVCRAARHRIRAFRDHRQGRDGFGAEVGRRHPRQVRRAGPFREPVPRIGIGRCRRVGGRPLIPASQIGAAAEEETSGRMVHVLVRPADRAEALLGGRLRWPGWGS